MSLRTPTVALGLLLMAGPAFAQGGSHTASQGELLMRLMLTQRSTGFGGIFAPLVNELARPSAPDRGCGQYTNYAACQASRAGDGWAADRLQRDEADGAERDWYNR